jgi:flagellar basal-body rod protein FlgG
LSPSVTIPTNYEQITVGSDGTISAKIPGQMAQQNIATMQLVRFSNSAGLDAHLGRNLLLETQASGAATESQPGLDGAGLIEQGFVENSNVQVVEEIIQLIVAQRAYEASSKVIQASDEMLQMANNVRR